MKDSGGLRTSVSRRIGFEEPGVGGGGSFGRGESSFDAGILERFGVLGVSLSSSDISIALTFLDNRSDRGLAPEPDASVVDGGFCNQPVNDTVRFLLLPFPFDDFFVLRREDGPSPFNRAAAAWTFPSFSKSASNSSFSETFNPSNRLRSIARSVSVSSCTSSSFILRVFVL